MSKTIQALQIAFLEQRKKAWAAQQWPDLTVEVGAQEPWKLNEIRTDSIFLPREKSWALRKQLPFVSTLCTRLEQFDFLLREHDQWVAQSLLRDALLEGLVRKQPDLSASHRAYLSGDEVSVVLFSSVVSHLGFSQVCLIQNENQDLSPMLPRLSQSNMGVEFQAVQLKDLSIMPNNGSILMNALPVEDDVPLLETLSYLNFLGKGSVVVDLNVLPIENGLVAETLRVGLQPFFGLEILAECDRKMFEVLFKTEVNPVDIEKWKSHFSEASAETPNA